jgi:hypothetical protein
VKLKVICKKRQNHVTRRYVIICIQELRDAMSVFCDVSYWRPPEFAALPLEPSCCEKCTLTCVLRAVKLLGPNGNVLAKEHVPVPWDSAVYEFHDYKLDRL